MYCKGKPEQLEIDLFLIKTCSEQIVRGFFDDKEIKYFLSAEFREVDSLCVKALSIAKGINIYHRQASIFTKKKSIGIQEIQGYNNELLLIEQYKTHIETINTIKDELSLFKLESNEKMLAVRTYVPEQYAGLECV